MNEESIQKYNSGISLTKLSKESGVSSRKMRLFLVENNIKIRNESEAQMKYKIDSNMFEKIDSNEKAYFLGWLFSDGNVYLGAGRYTISITVTESDRCILDYLNDKIYSPLKKLAYKKERIKISRGKEYLCKPCYKLQIDNKKMCLDLISLGCVPNKSKILQFPKNEIVPDQYFSSFLRGYFDGDGCVSVANGIKTAQIYLDGSYNFCEGLRSFLTEKIGIKCNLHFQNGCFRVCFGSKEGVLKFYNYIYSDGGFSLKRKKDKMESRLALSIDGFKPL